MNPKGKSTSRTIFAARASLFFALQRKNKTKPSLRPLRLCSFSALMKFGLMSTRTWNMGLCKRSKERISANTYRDRTKIKGETFPSLIGFLSRGCAELPFLREQVAKVQSAHRKFCGKRIIPSNLKTSFNRIDDDFVDRHVVLNSDKA